MEPKDDRARSAGAVPADEAARHREVAGRFSALVRATTDWSAPSPVEGWNAGDVVDHLLAWLPGLLEAHGVTLPRPDAAAGLDDDPREAAPDRIRRWSTHVAAVQRLLDDPASRAHVIRDSHFPEMSLTQMVDRLYTTDVFLHTWDLARATGQDDRLDEVHCAALLSGMQAQEGAMRSSGHYGPRVQVAPGASAQDRLIGFIGRDPAWRPG